MPLFSIITITRNNLDGLKKTAQSVATQTYDDYEWLVIDGASDDGTTDYLKQTSSLWLSAPDQGIYDAMNKGITQARGAYVLFLNAGDRLARTDTLETIKTKIKAQISPHPALIYGDALEERPGQDDVYKKARPHDKIAQGLFTHHQAILYRRDKIGALRYDLTYAIAADYDFTLRFLEKNAYDALYIPAPLCLFEAGGISQQKTARGRAEQFHIRKKVLKQNLLANFLTVGKQACAQALRDQVPDLYWSLRNKK